MAGVLLWLRAAEFGRSAMRGLDALSFLFCVLAAAVAFLAGAPGASAAVNANLQTHFGGTGSGAGNLSAPADVATDSEGDVWVADTNHNRIQQFDSEGEFIRQFGGKGSAPGTFKSPIGVALDSEGDLYVADAGNARIQKFDSEGQYLAQWGASGFGDGQFSGLKGIAIDSEDNVWTLEPAW